MATSSLLESAKHHTSGAFGAGLVLVFLPGAALVFGVRWLGAEPVLGLPILAIFGIMILFGALALISTLFARLNLDDRAEALALPPGSVRAAIALSLIVLFALISVMLYQTLAQTYKIEDLSAEEKASLVKEPANQVVAVIPRLCPPAPAATTAVAGAAASVAAAAASIASEASGTARASGQTCEPGKFVYTVHLRQAPTTESTDLAKQLLILIGTLMTSVVSFYFAAKSAEASTKAALAAVVASTIPAAQDAAQSGPGGAVTASTAASEDRVDGCDAPIEHATPDDELPPAQGGVAP